MKAFQLKVMIKESKPPIWRRVIVPAGITFSQLSMILNEAMGWAGYHLSDFEFYHRNLRISEEVDDYGFGGYGGFDELDAATTFIREFLEEEDWFTYTYDFGDNWEHRVTIEKVLEDYPHNYPQVVKFKGDCPPEDCGGIWGYYDCLDVISDPSNPEYEERLEWMEMQGYPQNYDMDAVNGILREQYFYKWGEGETRSRMKLQEEHLNGKYGLFATKQDENTGIACVDDEMDEETMIAELLRMKDEIERMREELLTLRGSTSLHDVFRELKKQDLLEIAKGKGLKGVSGANKEELRNRLVEFMLRPEEMMRYFSYLPDASIEKFERISAGDRTFMFMEDDDLEDLCAAAYIGVREDGSCEITEDVIAGYQNIKGEELDALRKRNSFLLACLRAAGLLYGITPMDVFAKLVKTGLDEDMDELEICTWIAEVPVEYRQYVVKNHKIYHVSLYPDDQGLLKLQGDGDYYIPTVKEIWELGTLGCLEDTPEMRALCKCLVQKGKIPELEAELLCTVIQSAIMNGSGIEDVIELLDEFGVEPTKWKQAQAITDAVMRLIENTRKAENRGFTAKEMREKAMRRTSVGPVAVFEGAPVSSPQKKIYPNDPCPCGSGKKFKNCCKNKL